MSYTKKTTSKISLLFVMAVAALAGSYLLLSSHALTPYSNPYSCSTHTQIQYGSTGTCVKYVQYTLHVVITGSFDSATKTAVQHFQFNNKIINSGCGTLYSYCDGIVGTYTWPKIDSYNAAQTQAALPTNTSLPTGSVSYVRCSASLTGSEYDGDRPTDGARVIIVAGGTSYPVNSTTRTWSWTIPPAIKNTTTYSIAVTGRNVNSVASYAGTNPALSGSPVSYNYGPCAPTPTPTPTPSSTTPPAGTTTPPSNTASPATTGTSTNTNTNTTTNTPATTGTNTTPSTSTGTSTNSNSNKNTGQSLAVVDSGSADAGSSSSAQTGLGVTTEPATTVIDNSATDSSATNSTTSNTNAPTATTKPKKVSSSLVKVLVTSFFAIVGFLVLVAATIFWYTRRRLEPSYDADLFAADQSGVSSDVPVTPMVSPVGDQPPAGFVVSTPAVTAPPSPYAPPVTDNAITKKINEAFYPNVKQPEPAAAAVATDKAAEVPDMFEIAQQHPESFGNAQNVLTDTPQPPLRKD